MGYDVAAHQRRKGAKTRARIEFYWHTYPGITDTDIAAALDLSRTTVRRHLAAMRSEWAAVRMLWTDKEEDE